MGKWKDLPEPGFGPVFVVGVVEKWAVIVPSTFPQRIFRTLRDRGYNLIEITEKMLRYQEDYFSSRRRKGKLLL